MSIGYVRVNVLVGDISKKEVKEVTFLVDTGAFFPVIPINLAKELNIEPLTEIELLLVDYRKITVGVSLAYFKVLDREGVFQVALMDSPEPLLGVIVLEGLGVRVDPTTGRLEYSRPYGLASLYVS